MTDAEEFPYVFRHDEPVGYKGRACKITRFGDKIRSVTGRLEIQTMNNLVAVEFPGGDKLVVQKIALVRRDSPMGRRVVAFAQRARAKDAA